MHLSFFLTGLNVSAYFWEIRVVRVMQSSTESLSMTFTDRQRDSGCLMHSIGFCAAKSWLKIHKNLIQKRLSVIYQVGYAGMMCVCLCKALG